MSKDRYFKGFIVYFSMYFYSTLKIEVKAHLTEKELLIRLYNMGS